MTFTYEVPPVLEAHQVRFWSGDTVEKPYSVKDEEISFLLETLDHNVMASSAVVADRIADYWASSSSGGGTKTVGPLSLQKSSSAEMEAAWRARAARLREGGSGGTGVFGGALFTGNGSPDFSIGMMDNGIQGFPQRDREAGAPNGVW